MLLARALWRQQHQGVLLACRSLGSAAPSGTSQQQQQQQQHQHQQQQLWEGRGGCASSSNSWTANAGAPWQQRARLHASSAVLQQEQPASGIPPLDRSQNHFQLMGM